MIVIYLSQHKISQNCLYF